MINIYVEGPDDTNFINNFILLNGTNNKAYKIVETGGWTKLNLVNNIIEQNKDTGGFNYIVFDADNDFNQRLNDIRMLVNMSKVDDVFLFPDHNSQGSLDTLLISIAHNSHSQVLSCFDGYRNCVTNHNPAYTSPNDKAKIFAYLESIGEPTKVGHRNYTNNAIWDLTSPHLINFRQLIASIF